MRAVKRIAQLLGLAVIGGLTLAWTMSTPSQCRAADTWTAKAGPWLDSLMTRTDSLNVALRQVLNLPQVTSSQIKYVTKAQTCAQAATAVDLLANTPNSNRHVYVYQLGTYYAVSDAAVDRQAEPGQIVDFFNGSFSHVSSTLRRP